MQISLEKIIGSDMNYTNSEKTKKRRAVVQEA